MQVPILYCIFCRKKNTSLPCSIVLDIVINGSSCSSNDDDDDGAMHRHNKKGENKKREGIFSYVYGCLYCTHSFDA